MATVMQSTPSSGLSSYKGHCQAVYPWPPLPASFLESLHTTAGVTSVKLRASLWPCLAQGPLRTSSVSEQNPELALLALLYTGPLVMCPFIGHLLSAQIAKHASFSEASALSAEIALSQGCRPSPSGPPWLPSGPLRTWTLTTLHQKTMPAAWHSISLLPELLLEIVLALWDTVLV